MNDIQKLILTIAALLPFAIYLFNPTIVGADTFFYINQSCGKMAPVVNDIIFDAINSIMPCNFLVMKLYGAVMFLIFVFMMAKIGELLDKEKGWWLGLIACSFSFFITEFMMYQNESIAYALFSISLYFIIRYSTEKKIWQLAASLIPFGLAGLAWKGSLYFGLTLIIYAPITAVVILPLILYYWQAFWWFTNAGTDIAFYTPLIGIVFLGISTLFLFGLVKSSKKQALSWVFSIPFLLFVQRLYVIAVPTTLIVAFNGIKSLKIRPETIESTLITFTIFMSIFWGIHTFSEFPTAADIELIEEAKLCSSSVQNSFGPGYLLIYHDLNVSSYGYPHYPDYQHIGCLILEKGIEDNNCPTLKESDNLKLQKC